jgi:predicted Zn-dependent protease
MLGQSSSASSARYASVFDATARSFRALRKSELASIEVLRLRVREARAGETPAGIAQRVGSAWEPAEIAVVNSVEAGAAFQAGARVKVALRERYSRRAP